MGRVGRKPSGLTLIELMISFVIILLIALYLMSLFATGQIHWKRAQQYSIASFLVNDKLQEVMQIPLISIRPGPGSFSSPFSEYTYQVDLIPCDSNLYSLDVEVVSNGGSVARASTLIGGFTDFQGVAVDPFTNLVAYSNPAGLKFYDDVKDANTDTVAFPDSRVGGGVSGFPGSNLLWQIGQSQGLAKFLQASNKFGVLGTLKLAPAPQASPRFGGVASDRFGNTVVAGDTSNRCLWIYQDPSSVLKPLRPVTTALGIPSGVAMDGFASLVWVADQENQCLRKFVFQTGPQAGFEADASGRGLWQLASYRPQPPMMMGAPQGIAMDSQGWAVYIVDGSQLYRMIDNPTAPQDSDWQVLGQFPQYVIDQGISGLTMDAYGSLLFINTRQGNLYKLPIPAPLSPAAPRALLPATVP